MTEPTKWHVRPAKTQISLRICPVWSESSLSAWRNIGASATHWAHSEDFDQTGRMPRLIWVFAGRTVILLVLSWGGSYCPDCAVTLSQLRLSKNWIMQVRCGDLQMAGLSMRPILIIRQKPCHSSIYIWRVWYWIVIGWYAEIVLDEIKYVYVPMYCGDTVWGNEVRDHFCPVITSIFSLQSCENAVLFYGGLVSSAITLWYAEVRNKHGQASECRHSHFAMICWSINATCFIWCFTC